MLLLFTAAAGSKLADTCEWLKKIYHQTETIWTTSLIGTSYLPKLKKELSQISRTTWRKTMKICKNLKKDNSNFIRCLEYFRVFLDFSGFFPDFSGFSGFFFYFFGFSSRLKISFIFFYTVDVLLLKYDMIIFIAWISSSFQTFPGFFPDFSRFSGFKDFLISNKSVLCLRSRTLRI